MSLCGDNVPATGSAAVLGSTGNVRYRRKDGKQKTGTRSKFSGRLKSYRSGAILTRTLRAALRRLRHNAYVDPQDGLRTDRSDASGAGQGRLLERPRNREQIPAAAAAADEPP